MIYRLIIAAAVSLWCHIGYSQATLYGEVSDESKELLTGATVVLLEDQDSSMVAFAISDERGGFRLDDLEPGNYILQISFVGYGTLNKPIIVQAEEKTKELGNYELTPEDEVLQEITVKAEHIPIGLIGDTISYNTAAFKTKPGASVEDLLKNLPGVEVERDGSIKAMGEDVENVLVDGKEFFGNDPKIATRNLEAEAVEKVQVFDKKSEIAEFTGIDDGDDEKTINLKLKEDYKHGGFGNVDINGGTDGNYSSKLNYNRFSPTDQAAIILSANNINRQSFSFNEYIQFMGGIGNAISSNNGMINFGEFGGAQAPRGISDNISGGLNFNKDLSSKLKLTSHYFFLSDAKDLIEQTDAEQFIDGGTFSSVDNTERSSTDQNHRLSTKLTYKPNPFNQLIIKNNLSAISNDLNGMRSTLLSDLSMSNITNTSGNQIENAEQLGYEGSIQYRRRLKKEGRNWISSVKTQIGSYNQMANVRNLINSNSIAQSIDQLQDYDYDYSRADISTTYTEPLGQKTYLSFDYNLDLERETPTKNFFDIENGSENYNSTLSGSFIKDVTLNKAGWRLAKNKKNLKMSIGLHGQWSDIDGFSQESTMSFINSTFRWLPSFSLGADLSSSKSIDLSYNTSLRLPSLSQLAPLPDNVNPNLLILGDPNLDPEYSHTLSLGYSAIDRFNFKNFFVNLNLSVIQDRIVNNLTVAQNLLRTSKPINTDLFTSLNGYISYSAPIRPFKMKFRSSITSSFASYTSFLNGVESGIDESNSTIALVLGNRNKKNIDIDAGIRLNYTTRDYEVNSDFSQSFFNYSLYWNSSFSLPKGWELDSSFDFIDYSDEFFGAGLNYKLWNMSIEKGFNENKWAIKVTAYDLLGQNQGVNRAGGFNSLFTSRFNTLTRYVMIGLRYKLGRKKQKQGIEFG